MVTRSELIAIVEEVLEDHEVDSAGGVASDVADRLLSEPPDAAGHACAVADLRGGGRDRPDRPCAQACCRPHGVRCPLL